MNPFDRPDPGALLADLNRLHDLLANTADNPIPVLQDVVHDPSGNAHLKPLLESSTRQLLQEIIRDFTPQITAELERRLQLHLNQLISQQEQQSVTTSDPFSFQP